MDGSKIYRFTFKRSGFRTVGYLLGMALLAVAAGVGYAFLPDAEVAASVGVSAPEDAIEESVRATQEMIDFALNLRSASPYMAYAARGIVESGNAAITGAKADAPRTGAGRKSTKELANAISAMRQLPCRDAKAGGLAGRTFEPGVYCMGAAELAGEVILNARGSAAGTFIFLIDGTLNVKDASSITLENGAQAGNVFFVASEADIGDDVVFRGNLVSEDGVKAGRSSVVGRVLTLGKAELNGSLLLGATTGTMRICVDQPLPVSPANSLSNRIFHFTVTASDGPGTPANPVKVATGTCSASFSVLEGPQTVTELNSGTLVNPPSGTFQGGFELVSVAKLAPASPSTLGQVNLATRTANVNIVPGDAQNQITLRFTNRRAVTGFVEVCKRRATGPGELNSNGGTLLGGGDPDVQGFFQYTIEDVFAQTVQNPPVDADGDGQPDPATFTKVLQVFTIPVGQCTGPITVTKGDPAPFDLAAPSTIVSISELPRNGTFLESVEVIPANRRNSPDVLGSILTVDPSGNDLITAAPGGGRVSVILRESGAPADETLAVFTNRSNPSRLKVCKVAGPGIPVNTLFRFTVSGWGAISVAHPQAAAYGPVTRTVDVRAGDPAQGGTCEFVPGVGHPSPLYDIHQTFVNGTPITIVENGLSPDNTIAQNPGQLRVSMVDVFGSVFSPPTIGGSTPNPDTSPATDRIAQAVVTARASILETRFSTFRFNPTLLKVCSIGVGSTQGQTINFTVATVNPTIGGPNPGIMFPAFTQSISVIAGPAGTNEGNCAFVNGVSLPGGAFNQGSTVRVTETSSGIEATSVTSSSAGEGGFTFDPQTSTATFSGPNGLGAGINSVVFTISPVPPCRPSYPAPAKGAGEAARIATSCRATRFDFDRDGKADPALYNRSTGEWTIIWSLNVSGPRIRSFGVMGDIPVPHDFDGDRITDFAVYRPSDGRWFVQGTANGGSFTYFNWGEVNDKPLPGDYDGDGKADAVLYRPSNGTWYMRNTQAGFRVFQFGIATDEPAAADFDGDGRTDTGVFRNGTWYILNSTEGFRVTAFGQAGDVPVPADYDGDGKADLAMFRNGTWYTLTRTAYTVKQLGTDTDIPAPADYDGDGKTDLAVYRPSEGRFYIKRSATAETSTDVINLGQLNAIPVQAPLRYFLQ